MLGVVAFVVSVSLAGCGESSGEPETPRDPGTAEWELVPRERVAAECNLDPDLLEAANEMLDFPWAIVRYGKLCHENYPNGDDRPEELLSAGKSMGAVMLGALEYRTRELEATGRKTGPFSDETRVDHWLDSFDFNADARIGHVLGMVAHNEDLSFGARDFDYDSTGVVQINRLYDVAVEVIAQDPEGLGQDLNEFTQRFVFDPLGMNDSSYDEAFENHAIAYGWHSTVRDMARLGLFVLNGGEWNGERLVDASWMQKMTRPAFEDATTGYAYLTWVSTRSNYANDRAPDRLQGPNAPCSPAAIWPEYPHGLSDATDCGYELPYTCEQEHDVGVWSIAGFGGQHIVGHPGLDAVFIAKHAGVGSGSFATVWNATRPALVALDPTFAGDEDAFCEAYANNRYAPDL